MRQYIPLLALWLALLLPTGPSYAQDSHAGQASQSLPEMIQSLFPKATRIEDKLEDYPVYPIYQLHELLGYAYESKDISDLPGFSGKPIRLLIGIDTIGNFTGVRVVSHHEPVFLHGLGEQPLWDFVDQYEGRSLKDHIVIDSSKAGASQENTKSVVYFDGVSKATVSIVIINDTVLSSALKVARKKLEGFTQAPSVQPKADYFEALSWDQLLERGYVGHWTLSIEEAETELGSSLSSYPSIRDPDDDEGFIDLYYAYINAPMVGRNLLGEEGFKQLTDILKPGEQLLLVMSNGLFPHVSESYRPGSVPSRLAMTQNELGVELRDTDILDRQISLTDDLPYTEYAHLFRVGGHAGFNPGEPTQLNMNLELRKNHLVINNIRFSQTANFADDLFERVEVDDPFATTRDPLWVGLWKNRWIEIVLLVASLTLLTWVFAHQERYIRNAKTFEYFRWGFLAYTTVFIGYYAQGQLSVVNIYTLFLQVWDGFDIGIFLLDPVIFILWMYTFISLFIWGRGLFCGWLCPFGAMQEMVSWIARKLHIKQVRIPEKWHRRLILIKYPLLLGLVATAFHSLTLAEQLAEVEPFKTALTLNFVRHWPFVLYAIGLLIASLFIHKFYCRYLCPLGAGLAALGRLRLFSWLERVDMCGSPCQLCKRRCGINAIRSSGEIDYDECIQCLECVVILKDDNQCVSTLTAKKRQRKRARSDTLLATDATQPEQAG